MMTVRGDSFQATIRSPVRTRSPRQAVMRFSFLIGDPIPTLAELDHRMEVLASLGYQGIELSAFYPPSYPVEEVAQLAERHRLPVVSLLSGWSYAHEGLCLCSPDSLVRDR